MAFRVLSTEDSADACSESSRLHETVNLDYLKNLIGEPYRKLESEWLRLPEARDFKRPCAEFGALGSLGPDGAVDCASSYWDMCPVAWERHCKGKRGLLLRLEVICCDYLRMLCCSFGAPGAKNDL